jgi:hypothetical protein
MKKITTLSDLQKKFSQIIMATMLLFTSTLFSQDVLLGQYEFTTGDNQAKPSAVVEGLTFSDFYIYPGKLNVNYTGNAIETSNWKTSMGVSGGTCVQFSISKIASLSEFNVARIDITLKRTTANKLQVNCGNEINTTDVKAFAPTTPYGTSTFATYSLVEGNPTPALVIPAITDASAQYLCIGTMSASIDEVVTIDKIEVYGTYTQNLSPSLYADLTSKHVNASKSYPLTYPIQLSGANMTSTTSISVTGTDAAYFGIDKTSVTAVDMNGAIQTVNVTYASSATTYNPVTLLHTPHAASLHIENADVATIDIPLTANCNMMYEDFSNYDLISVSGATLSALPVIPDDVPLSITPGWLGDYLYAYKAGSPNLGTVCLGSTVTDSSYLTTPAMDLSQPFNLIFKQRSLVKDLTDGIFKVYLDGNQLIYTGINKSNSLTEYTTKTFVGTNTSKLTFTGRKVDLSEIIIDAIAVNYSASPALNVALNKVENFGIVSAGTQKTVEIPIKGYNLTGDLTVSLKNGTNFSLMSGATIAQATATSGSDISVRFTAPVSLVTYLDTLVIGTTDFVDREIILKATSDAGTGSISTKEGKVIVSHSGIQLTGYQGKDVEVFNVAGLKINERRNIADDEIIFLNNKGCYILNIQDGINRISKKIIIQ